MSTPVHKGIMESVKDTLVLGADRAGLRTDAEFET